MFETLDDTCVACGEAVRRYQGIDGECYCLGCFGLVHRPAPPTALPEAVLRLMRRVVVPADPTE